MNELTDQTFDIEINKSKFPIIIDFYTEWCGPCKMMTPMIEEIAKEYKDQLTILKVDIDKCPDLIKKYNIMSIPTLLYLDKNKKVIDQISGFHNKDLLIKKTNEIIKS